MNTTIWFIVAVIGFGAYFYFSRQMWNIIDTPTVTPSGAFVGLCEVQGLAKPAKLPSGEDVKLFTGPVSQIPCVWFYTLVEYYQYDGKNSSWKTFEERSAQEGFRIGDQYGSIAVIPGNSLDHISDVVKNSKSQEHLALAYNYFKHFKPDYDKDLSVQWTPSPDGYYMWHPSLRQWIPAHHVSPDKNYYYDWSRNQWIQLSDPTGFGAVTEFFSGFVKSDWSKHTLRVTEKVITPDASVFAHGYVAISQDGTDLSMDKRKRKGKKVHKESLYVSNQGEKNILRKLRLSKWLALLIATCTSFLFYCYVFGVSETINEKYGGYADVGQVLVEVKKPFVVVIVVAVIGLLLLKMLRTYNRFIRIREQVRLSRSAIDIALKRRSSLIPELCDVLQGVMKHEATVLDSITQLRSANPDQASKQFIALAESYPAIKSSENFLHMQNELGRTEEKIAMARSFLSDSILAMDNLRATLSGMVFSPFFAKEQRPTL